MKKYKYLKAGLIAVFLVLTGIIYSCQRNGKEQPDSTLGTPITAEETKPTGALTELPEDTDKRIEEKCYVHICGAVKKPGVYEVSKGARIFEAVDLAGGFTKDADKNVINQAASVEDGQQIYIPSKDEVIKEESGKASGRIPGTGQPGDNAGNSGKVNINTATKEELCSLPGIGQAKADSIIDYRTNHGRFQNIEELKQIDGIKDGVYNKIKDKIISE